MKYDLRQLMPHAAPGKSLLRNASLVAGLIAVLFGMYVLSWFGAWWAWSRGWMSMETADRMSRTMYAPLEAYSGSDLPGADTFSEWTVYVTSTHLND
jgi:hypothetical protein